MEPDNITTGEWTTTFTLSGANVEDWTGPIYATDTKWEPTEYKRTYYTFSHNGKQYIISVQDMEKYKKLFPENYMEYLVYDAILNKRSIESILSRATVPMSPNYGNQTCTQAMQDMRKYAKF